MINLEITNNYIYALGYFPYCNGEFPQPSASTIVIPMGETKTIASDEDAPFDPFIIDVPAMGAILVDQLQDHKVPTYDNTDGIKKKVGDEYVDYKYGTLIRYYGLRLYFRYDEETLAVKMELDRFGCITINEISSGKVVIARLPEMTAKYPFH